MARVRFVALPNPLLREALTATAGWRSLGERILAKAKEMCPVSEGDDSGRDDGLDGHLRDKLEVRFITGVDPRILVGARDPRADWVVNGTEPHPIDPVNASVLVFTSGGETVFARHVDHPGTDPNPFLWQAMETIVRGQ